VQEPVPRRTAKIPPVFINAIEASGNFSAEPRIYPQRTHSLFGGVIITTMRGTADDPFAVTGSDLYRISGRIRHKADGTEAPPDIRSLLEPVRSPGNGRSSARDQASVQWMTTDIDRARQRRRTTNVP
jgi:hypothetical protein